MIVPRLHPQAHGRPSWADGTAVRGAPPLREEVVRPQRTRNGKESTQSLALSDYSAPGGLREGPGAWGGGPALPQTRGKGESRKACRVVHVGGAECPRADGGTRGAV